MLQEYRQYIINLRNNLIQCGIEYPVNSLETYESLFYEASNLEQVLWYFSVLSISNSEGALSDYFIPLSGYFKEKIREQFYNDFQSFLEDYKKISVLATTSDLSYVPNTAGVEEEEEIDLFDESLVETSNIEDIEGEEYVPPVIYNEVSHGVYLEDIEVENQVANIEDYESVSHGVFLEDISIFSNETSCVNLEDSVYLNQEYTPHGVFLEDVVLEDNLEEDDLPEEISVPLDDDEEEYEEPDYENMSEEDLEEEISVPLDDDEEEYEEPDYEDISEEDLEEEISVPLDDDEEEYEEPDYENMSEEDLEEEISVPIDEDEEEYEEFDYENVSEDDLEEEISVPMDDEEDEYEEPDYENMSEEDLEEEISVPMDDEEEEYEEPDYKNMSEDDLEDEVSVPLDDEEDFSPSKPQQVVKPVQKPKQPRDLSDYLQDTTNSALTGVKRFLIKEKQKLKNG